MTTPTSFGAMVYGYFLEYLPQQKGLSATSIRSYRDTMRLYLKFAAGECRCGVSALGFEQLGFERVLAFLRNLEQTRHNAIATRNQRLAALHTFYEYVGQRMPEMLHVCAQVAAIPSKRCPPPETRFMARDEVEALFEHVPIEGRLAQRDRALLLFLYNTGARVSEVAALRVEQLALETPPHARLLGKGGKWRTCPLWQQTADSLRQLLARRAASRPQDAVFVTAKGEGMTRFGIYKRVRALVRVIERGGAASHPRRITPHVFRHTTAVHLLEAGVEVNVIRGWLGHVSLDTTNRYAEITVRMKEEALGLCDPPSSARHRPDRSRWHGNADLMQWLASL